MTVGVGEADDPYGELDPGGVRVVKLRVLLRSLEKPLLGVDVEQAMPHAAAGWRPSM
jgi:hypothetical protein